MMTPGKGKLRSDLINMLLTDREHALHNANPSAAVAASSRVVDLMLGRLSQDDELDRHEPVDKIRIIVVHQAVCPVCKEAGPITDAAPVQERRRSAWDE
jgi:hypothetical protein